MSRAESRPGTDSVRGKRSCGEPTPVWMTAKLDRGKRASSSRRSKNRYVWINFSRVAGSRKK